MDEIIVNRNPTFFIGELFSWKMFNVVETNWTGDIHVEHRPEYVYILFVACVATNPFLWWRFFYDTAG